MFLAGFLGARELVERLSEYSALFFMRKEEYNWMSASGAVNACYSKTKHSIKHTVRTRHHQSLAKFLGLPESLVTTSLAAGVSGFERGGANRRRKGRPFWGIV